MAKYDFAALPVLGPDRKLLGVITFDDVMDVLTQEQTEDVQRLAAVEPIEDGYFQTTFWTFIRKRGPWLAALFISEFFTGTALRHYDEVIQAVAKLSYYVPLLISTGGNSGSQSSTLVIRGLAVGDIKTRDWLRVLGRELVQGVVLGLMLATLGVGRVLLAGDGFQFAAVVALTLTSIVVMGCVVGGMMPILLHRFGIDPATSSNPFIATLVDVLGILIYLSLAQVILGAAVKQLL